MKIAMLHTSLTARGGGERQILRLAVELQKRGHEVKFFVNAVDEEKCYPELLNKVAINVIPHPLARFKSLYRKAAKKRVILYDSVFPRMINMGRSVSKEFDIINNHNFHTEWAAFFARTRLKIPAVWMCNEPPFWFWHLEEMEKRSKIDLPLYEIFDKVSAKYIDEILVLSRVAQKLVEKVYNRQARIVRSGVDVEFFHNASKEEVRKKHGLENDFILLQTANISALKRQSDAVEALYYLSKSYDNVKLILDGSGPKDALMRLGEKVGVKDKILFLHSTNDEELAKMYAACDVFVFPSQITWGLAATEAMAAGKPVIASKKAGVSEIIQNGVNGMVVDHAKPEELAKQVEILMNTPKLRKRIGENAYEYVKNNLSWEKYAGNMESIFQQTIFNFKKG
jgi:glycosyltransferase involved in cell wall biosynthesis